MNLFELAAKLTLDSSEYEKGLGSAESKSKSFGSKVGGALKSLAKVGAVAMTAASAAVIKFGKDSIEAGMEFETSFAQLSTIMDETQKSAEEMKAGLMNLSNQMGISASELAETTYNAISATGDTAGALTIVENASKLAKAGFTDTSSALSTLTTVMNSYGMTAEDTVGISDSLVTVQNLGVTTVAELSSAMGKAIATASAYGVDLYNLESAYISLTKNGINTSESTTYISAMLNELGKDSSKVSKILKQQTGKSFAELMREGQSLGDVLGILSESVDNDSAALINLWGSAEAGKAASAIASQGLDQFNDNLRAVAGSAGATQKAFEKMQNTLSAKIDKLKTSFNNLQIAVSEGITPSINEFVDAATTGLQNITDAYQEGGIEAALETFGSELGNLSVMVAQKAPEIAKSAVNLLKSFVSAITDNASLLAQSAVDIVTAISDALGDQTAAQEFGEAAVTMLTQLIAGLANALPSVMTNVTNLAVGLIKGLTSGSNLSNLVGAAGDLLVAVFKGALASGGTLAMAMPDLMVDLGAAILAAIPQLAFELISGAFDLGEEIGRGIVEGFNEETSADKFEPKIDPTLGTQWLSEFVINNLETLQEFQNIINIIGNLWSTFWNNVEKRIDDARLWVSTKANEIVASVVLAFTEIRDKAVQKWEETKQNIQNKLSEIKQTIHQKWEEIKLSISATVELIKSEMQRKWDEIKQKIVQPVEEAKEKVDHVIDTIRTTLTGLASSAFSWGSDLLSNFVSGIKSMWSSLTSTVTNIASTVKSLLGFSEPEKGPLSDFHTYAPDMMSLFIKGIKDNEQALRDQISETFDIRKDMNLTGDYSGAVGESGIYSLLAQYLPQIGNMTVVLDTGALVGAIAPEMDDALGARASFAARGVTA